MTAIKRTLIDDNYDWNDNRVLVNTLTKACRLINDKVRTRLPIHKNLLEMILFELERSLKDQLFLKSMYKAMFILAYYGLFRIGELAKSKHSLKAKDIHIRQE